MFLELKKYKFRLTIFCVCLVLSFSACKKYEKQSFVKSGEVVTAWGLYKASGTIIDIGENGVDNYGHCWSTNLEPSVSDNKTSFGPATEIVIYESSLSELMPSSVYYVRTYIEDEGEVKYGTSIQFTTEAATVYVHTGGGQIINSTTANVTGLVANLGSYGVIQFGHCWSDIENPTITNSLTTFGSVNADTSFVSNLSALSPEITYHIRAYAILQDNSVVYSNDSSFTIANLVVNSVSDSLILSGITNLKGEIVTLGYEPVTEHGFCWSYTSASPDYNGTKIELGTINNPGFFTGTLSGIQNGVTYYWRAYAVTSGNIKYGSVKNFQR